jgi:PPM family protein phosphatase
MAPMSPPPAPAVPLDHGWATAAGRRPDNQDRCAATGTWAVVSDGAGGHRGGALAATLTVEAVAAGLAGAVPAADPGVVHRLVAAADGAVRARQAADPGVATMAATVPVAVAAPGDDWWVGHVGDSPAWRVGGRTITRLTEDHNAAAALVRAGLITAAEARAHPGRHMITRAVGAVGRPVADVSRVTLGPGERLVLASDGVGVLGEAAIMDAVLAATTAASAARRLVAAAVAAGSQDNVTAVVIGRPGGGPG